MPVTPFHLGPGAAMKAVAPQRFSFTVFCLAQVATDCEALFYMLRHEYPWHRFFHTYPGATLMAVLVVLIGRPLCQWALRVWTAWPGAPFLRFFPSTAAIPWESAISGGFLGTYSHVLLDSIMHRDVMPLMPFSPENPMFRVISLGTLHAGCLTLGLLGAVGVWWRGHR